MAFTIGNSSTIAKWFDYATDGEKTIRIKVRSAEYEPFLAAHNRAGTDFNAQFHNPNTAEHKPYDYFLMQAFALLIEDWQNVDLERYDDQGVNLGIEENAPCTDKNKLDVLYAGDSSTVIWNFVKNKAEEIAKEVRLKRLETMGKQSNSTNGRSKTASSRTSKRNSGKPKA